MEEYVEILEFLTHTHTHTDTQGVLHVDALLFFLTVVSIHPIPVLFSQMDMKL